MKLTAYDQEESQDWMARGRSRDAQASAEQPDDHDTDTDTDDAGDGDGDGDVGVHENATFGTVDPAVADDQDGSAGGGD